MDTRVIVSAIGGRYETNPMSRSTRAQSLAITLILPAPGAILQMGSYIDVDLSNGGADFTNLAAANSCSLVNAENKTISLT